MTFIIKIKNDEPEDNPWVGTGLTNDVEPHFNNVEVLHIENNNLN